MQGSLEMLKVNGAGLVVLFYLANFFHIQF